MSLPVSLKLAMEELIASIGVNNLMVPMEQLSQRYRDQEIRKEILKKKKRFVDSDAQRAAYVLARMPATFGALKYVLQEIKNRLNEDIHSILDVGSGPGTSLWASSEVFPEACEMTLLEQDDALITLGKKLTMKSPHALIKNAKWVPADILQQERFPESDLVIVSYSMGEWPQESWSEVIKKLWSSARKALVVVEPGTMYGFSVIRPVRQYLIELGGRMIAPCPHTLQCPMPENNWCHFSVRIERSSMHRKIKSGSLGYEDEKFSYVAVSKSSVELPEARILRHPQKHSGHISFMLCTKHHGLQNKIISRRDGELYKQARHLEWGDTF